MPVQSTHRTQRRSFRLIESLESRTLLASTAPFFGSYTGTDTYSFDGKTHKDTVTVVISPISSTSAYTAQSDSTAAQIAVARSLGPLAQINIGEQLFFNDSPAAVPQSRTANSGNLSPLSTNDFVGSFPSKLGSGTVQIDGNSLTIRGTVDTGIFMPTTINFSGTKVVKKSAVAAPAVAPAPAIDSDNKTLFTTLSLEQTLSLNPAIGTFLGHMTRASDSTAFKTSAVIAKNSKGHTAITFQLIEPGVGTIVVQSVIHPTHTGAFTLPLGNSAFDGTISGHITHTRRLVLHLIVPEFSTLVGTQVRH
jgi:hypothetical protein